MTFDGVRLQDEFGMSIGGWWGENRWNDCSTAPRERRHILSHHYREMGIVKRNAGDIGG